VGYQAGYSGTTAAGNAFYGYQSGYGVTTGSKNVIIGSYTGSAAPISATGNNYIVLSDGDGNIVASTKTAQTFALQGGTLSTGTGIAFPATQSASTDANTLDDYEEGTWTPTIYGTTTAGTTTYFQQAGTYTKIGRVVTVQAFLNITNQTGTGSLRMGGLPFTAGTGGNTFPCAIKVENLAVAASYYPVFSVVCGTTYINMQQTSTGGGGIYDIPIDTAFVAEVTATYFV
jgi:hypothetical protein